MELAAEALHQTLDTPNTGRARCRLYAITNKTKKNLSFPRFPRN
jgi:hypothetical protein